MLDLLARFLFWTVAVLLAATLAAHALLAIRHLIWPAGLVVSVVLLLVLLLRWVWTQTTRW